MSKIPQIYTWVPEKSSLTHCTHECNNDQSKNLVLHPTPTSAKVYNHLKNHSRNLSRTSWLGVLESIPNIRNQTPNKQPISKQGVHKCNHSISDSHCTTKTSIQSKIILSIWSHPVGQWTYRPLECSNTETCHIVMTSGQRLSNIWLLGPTYMSHEFIGSWYIVTPFNPLEG